MASKCEDCIFWVRLDSFNNGECRRYPPKIVSSVGSQTIHDDRQGYMRVPTSWESSEFPHTKPDQWCGEFKQSS